MQSTMNRRQIKVGEALERLNEKHKLLEVNITSRAAEPYSSKPSIKKQKRIES